jgi:transposase
MPIKFLVTAGQENEMKYARILLDNTAASSHIIADRGYDADYILQHITSSGAIPVIPPRCSRIVQRTYDRSLYKQRNHIERLFGKLKQFRKIATLFEKIKLHFESLIFLACSFLWLN